MGCIFGVALYRGDDSHGVVLYTGGTATGLGISRASFHCVLSCAAQGVIEFSLCLLFAKLVSYTFLYWLPLYIFNVGESQGKKS